VAKEVFGNGPLPGAGPNFFPPLSSSFFSLFSSFLLSFLLFFFLFAKGVVLSDLSHHL